MEAAKAHEDRPAHQAHPDSPDTKDPMDRQEHRDKCGQFREIAFI
jgi:hypothetical protein